MRPSAPAVPEAVASPPSAGKAKPDASAPAASGAVSPASPTWLEAAPL